MGRVAWLFVVVLLYAVPAFAVVEPAGSTEGYSPEIARMKAQAARAERRSRTALATARQAKAKASQAAAVAEIAKGSAKSARSVATQANDLAVGQGKVLREVRGTVSGQKTRIENAEGAVVALNAKIAHIYWWLWCITGVIGVAILVMVARRTGLLERLSEWATRESDAEPEPAGGGFDPSRARPDARSV